MLSPTEVARFQGFLNVHKPVGLISRRVVDRVLRLFRECGVRRKDLPKVGHAGTLDPLASGVLVVCIGKGTRLIDLLHEGSKSYQATFQLGCRSTTDDIHGEMINGDVDRAARVTRAELDEQLDRFRGSISQIPPAFSAVKVEGTSAYKFARRGRELDLSAKTVTIHRLEVTRFEPPELDLAIECSSGTYIRAIARDLGERLGCGAVMSALCRTRSGLFPLADAIHWDALSWKTFAGHIQPCVTATQHLSAYQCNDFEHYDLAHGQGIAPRTEGWLRMPPSSDSSTEQQFALLGTSGELIAIGGWDKSSPVLRPRINLVGIS